MKQIDFSKSLANFFGKYLQDERNVSPNTIATYRDAFVLFLEFLRDVKGKKAEKVELTDISKDNVTEFLSWLIDVKTTASPHVTTDLLPSMHLYHIYSMNVSSTLMNGRECWLSRT